MSQDPTDANEIHRPPSIADGTISTGLVLGLRRLIDEFGLAGVWSTLEDPDLVRNEDLLERAWGLIANAHGGNWDHPTGEWREAAERWRDDWHSTLDGGPK